MSHQEETTQGGASASPAVGSGAARRRSLAMSGDLYGFRLRMEYERILRDVEEACEAEEDLARHAGPGALHEVAIDREGRREAVRIIREDADGPGSDKAAERRLHHGWTPEHERRWGRRPDPSSVRRWDRIDRRDGDVPERPFGTKSTMRARPEVEAPPAGPLYLPGQHGDEHPWTRWVRPARRPDPAPPAATGGLRVGDTVLIRGRRYRLLGVTATGRLALARVSPARKVRTPAVLLPSRGGKPASPQG